MIRSALVRDVVAMRPGAAEIFRHHKIDFYRIGNLAVREAAERQRIDVDVLSNALADLPDHPVPAPVKTTDLIDHIRRRYHKTHHNRLFAAARLARRVEGENTKLSGFATGVAKFIMVIAEALEDHQQKEEASLFPKMLFGPPRDLRFPILRQMLEHDDLSDQLDTLARMTNDFTPPDGASSDCRALCEMLSQIDADLRFHMHLENNVLFPRFAGERAIA